MFNANNRHECTLSLWIITHEPLYVHHYSRAKHNWLLGEIVSSFLENKDEQNMRNQKCANVYKKVMIDKGIQKEKIYVAHELEVY